MMEKEPYKKQRYLDTDKGEMPYIDDLYKSLIKSSEEGEFDICGCCRRGTPQIITEKREELPRYGGPTTRQMVKVYTFPGTPDMDVCITLFGGGRKL